jgi:phenylpropionate dioxygenase-like ring-hydroxylating dioxygenase large terminal subunit
VLEAGLWHPVASGAEVGAAPVAARLLERELVLWRAPAAGVQAWADRCPHRGTRLSLGRIVAGRLECAYHGWQFGAGGACGAIPALPEFTPGPAHAAQAYEAAEAHGVVWVRLERSAAPLPAIDAVPRRWIVSGPHDVATSAPRVVENFLDMSHFPFVHEGLLGDRGHAGVPHYDVTLTPDGRPVAPAYRAWQPQGRAGAAQGAWVDYRYEVLGPYAAVLFKQADAAQAGSAPREAYALWICPIAPEASRVWFTHFTSDEHTAEAELRAFQDGIFVQDRPVIESQQPRRLPLSGGEAHSAADRLAVAYRRYLRELGISFGVC